MPWVTINGEQKKVACGPCIRGHRSTQCNHKDRLLLEVRKPGRPLSSCPHLGGNCSCERLVINYTIPRSSECACPSSGDDPAPVAEVVSSTTGHISNASNRVQKSRHRKSVSSRSLATLEKAIKASEDAEERSGKSPPSKSCCGQKSSSTTVSSGNTSSVPTPASNSPKSRDEIYMAYQPNVESSTSGSVVENKPLRVQIEGPKDVTGHTPAIQIHSWRNTTLDGSSESKSVAQETSEGKGGCCGSKSEETAKEQAPHGAIMPTPLGPQHQSTTGLQSHTQPPQHSFDSSQQYPFLGGQTHINTQIHNPAFYNAPPAANAGYSSPLGNYATSYPPYNPGAVPGHPDLNNVSSFMHNCTCGDACACLGCAVHPRNEATMLYVREVTDFMVNDPFYASPSSSTYTEQQVQYNPAYPVPPPINSSAPGHGWLGTEMVQPRPRQASASEFSHPSTTTPYSQDVNGGTLWQPRHNSRATSVQATPTNELQQFRFGDTQSGQPNMNQHPTYSNQDFPQPQFPYQQPTTTYDSSMANAPFASADVAPSTTASATPVLSPTSFFWQEVELPGCNDLTGACRCGDGCQCVGCLTHGGHDGVQIDQPNTGYQPGPGFSPKLEPGLAGGHGGSMDAALDKHSPG